MSFRFFSSVLGHTLTFDSTFECAKALLNDHPMIGEPSLDYYNMVETDLRNRAIATVQRLDLELKIFDLLAAKHEIALDLYNEHKEVDAFLAE